MGAATAFDIFGTDNAEEILTCGFQYPSLPISILHFVARIFGHKWYNFALLNAGESASEMVLCPISWSINIHIFMPVRLDEISNSIVDTRLKFVYVYQKKIGLVYTYFFW